MQKNEHNVWYTQEQIAGFRAKHARMNSSAGVESSARFVVSTCATSTTTHTSQRKVYGSRRSGFSNGRGRNARKSISPL